MLANVIILVLYELLGNKVYLCISTGYSMIVKTNFKYTNFESYERTGIYKKEHRSLESI